jgi:integrase
MWNHARGWGYTDLPNPCEGIKGHSLAKRTVYITDEIFDLVHKNASLPLRITITGKLAELIDRIRARKETHKVVTGALLVNLQGKRLTKDVLRNHFDEARKAAAKERPEMADSIKEFWFYDLRAKAADDTSDDRDDQAASNLLGHENVSTTRRHYLRRGKIVAPTK